MANRKNGTLYCGVTSNLSRRAWEHRTGAQDGFTKRYACSKLVWYEFYERMDEAIAREKQIKAGESREETCVDCRAESRLGGFVRNIEQLILDRATASRLT
jgi:predicted GIY-YIG superfamily endonuclease